jgi:hypothetical protein
VLDRPREADSTPPIWFRTALAVIVGAFSGALLLRQPAPPGYEAADLTPILGAARMVLGGRSPYDGPTMLYPLPGVLSVTPFALLPVLWAYALWSGAAAALLTWAAVGRHGVHGLAIVLSKCANRALVLAQWSPWQFLGGLYPGWQVLAVAKPTLGLIVWCYRPTWWAFVGGAGLLALSFVLFPTWFSDWIGHGRAATAYAPAAAIWQGGGPLLLLAALRWRQPEARLLLAMAFVPHNFIWYDQLLLFLIPATAIQLWLLSALSWLSGAVADFYFARAGIPEPEGQLAFRAPIVGLMYLPCLVMVLRRPNVNPTPGCVEQRITRWVQWFRVPRP